MVVDTVNITIEIKWKVIFELLNDIFTFAVGLPEGQRSRSCTFWKLRYVIFCRMSSMTLSLPVPTD